MMFFTACGRVYWEKVFEIPEASRQARGKAMVNLLQLKPDEKISAMLCVQDSPKIFMVATTNKAVIKMQSFRVSQSGDGIIARDIDEGDAYMRS